MGKEVLTLEQKAVIQMISEEARLDQYYLSGGTALSAYHFHHRFSEDLDFFTFEQPDVTFLHVFAGRIEKELKTKEFTYKRLYDRNLFFFPLRGEELKMEFTLYPFPLLKKPMKKDGIRIDSLPDLAANKLFTLLERFDPKDYVDLYFIFQQYSLPEVQKNVLKKFSMNIDPIFLGSQFLGVRGIHALPKILKPVTIEELKDFFEGLCKKLSKQVIQ
jgi:predicted nucleotidyltransferase component of viral defense system